MSKIRVAVVFGGRSTEHEISLISAQGILKNINRDLYQVIPLKIDIEGHWFLQNSEDVHSNNGTPITLTQGKNSASILENGTGKILQEIDIVFPVLHGVFGEDGTIQGLLKMLNVAFVGCGVLASSTCMDKDVTKRLLRDANIPIAPYVCATWTHQPNFEKVKQELGLPLFIKPANLGSSVGVHKVNSKTEFETALKDALAYDSKVLIEQNINGREIEVAVMGNEKPQASLPGEIVNTAGFYDFESKYVSKDASSTHIPAKLTDEQILEVRETAKKAYATLGCEGLARVDFFISTDGIIMINEINTLPGFTPISMYPKMWEATGVSYSELIELLIQFGLERFEREQQLKIVARQVK
ncbi:D-alanine--D-alanine ligase family protein [uncultured Roseivirga sp.]|uniref:D-alanine--D-alanine ligase family protein n=1 Tax=uncultured Roseivirga sp. TaxID=543088 RepID=UPI0030DAF7A1|tara:strand:+ start:16241 stop:17308 length:1068 start_codon:yes stop_codon:yes gene_type:complete